MESGFIRAVFMNDLKAIVEDLVQYFEMSSNDGLDNVVEYEGQKLSIEVDVRGNMAIINTYHLIKDSTIWGQLNKNKIGGTTIEVTINSDGQVFCSFDDSLPYTSPTFIKSHSKKYYKGIVDYIDNYLKTPHGFGG